MKKQTKIEKLIASIRPHLPKGWSVCEAIGISLCSGRTTNPFASISGPSLPTEFNYFAGKGKSKDEQEMIREKRMLWRAAKEQCAREIARTLRCKLADGVAVTVDGFQVDVRFLD